MTINKKHILVFIIPILLAFIVSTCYYDSEEYLFPQINDNCDTTDVTYFNSVVPVLDQYCLGCHNNTSAASVGGNIKLEDYADVKIRVENGSLVGSISHSTGYSAMPKGASKLDDCTITIIKIWVDAGSPDN